MWQPTSFVAGHRERAARTDAAAVGHRQGGYTNDRFGFWEEAKADTVFLGGIGVEVGMCVSRSAARCGPKD